MNKVRVFAYMKFECPDREYLQLKSPKKLSSNNRNVTLFQQGVGSDCIEVFLEETLNCGVLDCGCPDNVCGSDWLNHALDSLDHTSARKLYEQKVLALLSLVVMCMKASVWLNFLQC